MIRNTVAVIAQSNASSGLSGYLCESLERHGHGIVLIDVLASKWFKLWPVIQSMRRNREAMWKARWENMLFSSRAWTRNTRRNGRLLNRKSGEYRHILQVGGYYFPHPDYRNMPYYLFITYPMILCYRDGIKPWIPPRQDRQVFLDLERELYQHAAHIFVNAAYVRTSLMEDYGVAPDRITVTGLGVNPFFLQNTPATITPEFTHDLLFVGYDFGYKGGADVLEALNIARKEIPDLTLTVVGPGPDQVPETPGVHLTGRIRDQAQLLEHYRKADLFVMPSLCDSFGFVFLEAMSQGVPCIGADLNAMPEIIRDGETGYVVPVRDPEALADALLRYYADPANRQRMGRAALERVRGVYTWDRVADRMKPFLGGGG